MKVHQESQGFIPITPTAENGEKIFQLFSNHRV
jgi:hypothetical protein